MLDRVCSGCDLSEIQGLMCLLHNMQTRVAGSTLDWHESRPCLGKQQLYNQAGVNGCNIADQFIKQFTPSPNITPPPLQLEWADVKG